MPTQQNKLITVRVHNTQEGLQAKINKFARSIRNAYSTK